MAQLEKVSIEARKIIYESCNLRVSDLEDMGFKKKNYYTSVVFYELPNADGKNKSFDVSYNSNNNKIQVYLSDKWIELKTIGELKSLLKLYQN